uniref:AtuA-related protein n=1 Tax=Bordetella sputigena TaxID=1416810 RepID=UPI0039EE9826
MAMNDGKTVIGDELTVPLYRVAHARTGDKGDRSNISLIAWDPAFYELLVAQVTPELVRAHFAHRKPTAVQRYLLPRLHAMNFVLDGVLDGGVNDALNLDTHGKTLSYLLLMLEVRMPAGLTGRLVGPA